MVEYNTRTNCELIIDKVPENTIQFENIDQLEEVICVSANTLYNIRLFDIM